MKKHDAPLPSSLAGSRLAERTPLPEVAALQAMLAESAPEIEHLASRLGLNIARELRRWVEESSATDVKAWVSTDSSRDEILTAWLRSKDQRPGLLAALVCEIRLSRNAAWLGPFNTFRLDLARTLRQAREDVARAASWIHEDDWGQRTSTARRMSLAAAYYLNLAKDAVQESTDPRADETVRQSARERQERLRRGWARATVISSRYVVADRDKLEDVRLYARTWNSADPRELTLVLENLLYLYDVFGDHTALREAVTTSTEIVSPEIRLQRAEAWIKLASTASREGAIGLLARARAELDAVAHDEDRLSVASFVVFAGWSEIEKVYRDRCAHKQVLRPLKGLRFPWGFRTPGYSVPIALEDVGQAVLTRLESDAHSNAYLIRDVRADVASSIARSLPPVEAIPYLRQAVETRAGHGIPHLPQFQSYFRNAEDLYHHATLDPTESAGLRRRAVSELLAAKKSSAAEQAASLVLIAQDLAQHGPTVVSGIGGDPEVLIAVSHGDESALMQRAAEILLRESQLDDTKLGGRGGVRAVRGSEFDDRHVFVLKETELGQVQNDLWAQGVLRPVLATFDHQNFKLADHVATVTSEQITDSERAIVHEVRWFTQGQILSDYVREHPGDQGIERLRDAAVYLGVFHRAMLDHPTTRGSGQELRKKDLGYWLKAILGANASAAFRSWRAACSAAPDVRRRDAHADNWIVTDSGSIVAFDFEASTSRPLFYELSQLAEDGQLLKASDLEVRNSLIESYIEGLTPAGILEGRSAADCRHLYAVGGLARCVRAMTEPGTTFESQQRAMQTFEALTTWLDPQNMPELFLEYVQQWWNDRHDRVLGQSKSIANGRRVRLSKAMSYHLRHNTSTLVGRDGWVHVDYLVDALQGNGHSADAATLHAIATSPEEHRFEVDGQEIRARYGHSRALSLKTTKTPASRDLPLYHGTPVANLGSILDARAGLRSRGREYVHLAESTEAARRPAERFGGPVVILEVAADTPGLLPESGGVWLADRVAVQHLSIVPLYSELRLV